MEPDKLVEEIYVIVRTIGEQTIDDLSGDTLSRLAVKLASYKASLGEYVSAAKRATNDAEAAYQVARGKAYAKLREQGKGTGDAGEMWRSQEEAIEALTSFNEAKEQSDRITQLSIDCHDLIDGIKSRLIYLQTERGEHAVY